MNKRIIVGTRFVEITEDGMRWGHVLRVEEREYNNFYVVKMDNAEEELFLFESICESTSFEAVLDIARVRYERAYADYREAITEHYEGKKGLNGYATAKEANDAEIYGTDAY